MESVRFPGQLLPPSSDQPLWPEGLAGAAAAAASPWPISTCQPFMGILMLKLSYPRARVCRAKIGCWVLCPCPEDSEWVSDSRSVASDSLLPHGLWPVRLVCPWDSLGKNTGVGCHFLLQAQKRMPAAQLTRGSCLLDRKHCSGQRQGLKALRTSGSSMPGGSSSVPTPRNHKSSSLLLAIVQTFHACLLHGAFSDCCPLRQSLTPGPVTQLPNTSVPLASASLPNFY